MEMLDLKLSEVYCVTNAGKKVENKAKKFIFDENSGVSIEDNVNRAHKIIQYIDEELKDDNNMGVYFIRHICPNGKDEKYHKAK